MVCGDRRPERVFIIAEAGVNHDGSVEKALRLIDVAADAGADAVKFQTFRADEVVTPDAKKAAYQERQTGEGTQYQMIRRLELDDAAHERLARHCIDRGVEFMSTPFAPWGVDMLIGLGMKRIKVASGEIVNKPLIEKVASAGLPIIISTGMAELEEVVRVVEWIRAVHSAAGHTSSPGDLVVLHCTSEYPAPASSVNLRAMDTMAAVLNLPVGYSDHTLGIEIAIAAVARGAVVVEKHFTENSRDRGPDHAASLEPDQLRAMVAGIRNVELALGDGVKQPMQLELPTRMLVRRSAFALADLKIGDRFTTDVVAFLRPGDGIGPERADWIFESKAARDIMRGSKLCEDDIE